MCKVKNAKGGAVMLAAFSLFAAQAADAVTPPLPLPDYAHGKTAAQAKDRAYFAFADTDRDSHISLAEAVVATRKDSAFQDTNHDGVVTPAKRTDFPAAITTNGKTPEGEPILPPAHRTGSAPEPWSPPAQAIWSGTTVPVRVTLTAGKAAMDGSVSLSVDLLATGDGVAISPFVQATRGIAFEVRTVTAELVAPIEPMPGSPPPPPLTPDQLTPIGRTTPFHVEIREKTRTIFPHGGLYRIRALVSLFDPYSIPARYVRTVSAPTTITVTR